MSTQAQILANRANAQSSTGPRTAAGLEATKHNATKHGLTGKQLVIRGEDPQAYDDLRDALIAQHAPANELEAMLVEQIAQNWWRLERARKFEAKMLDNLEDPYENKGFLNLQRQLARVESAWNKAVRDLAKLQKARKEEEADAPQCRPQPAPPSIGFVFANPAQPANTRHPESEKLVKSL